jgi:DNA polymerase III delta subunit
MAAKSDPALEAKILLIHGNDEFQVDQRARELLEKRCPGAGADGSLTTVDGNVDTVDDALEVLKQVMVAVQSSSLFSPMNVTWLKELAFLSGKVFQNPDVKDHLESFQELVGKGLGDGQLLLITVAGKLNASSRFAKALKGEAWVEEFQKTTKEWEVTDEASQLILEMSRSRSVDFHPEALREFAERVGNDSRRIRNEVEKLSLCTADGKVDKETVELMVPLQQEAQAWKLSDCIGAGDLAGAIELLQRMETQGVNPVAAMAMLHNSLREMAYLGTCLHQGAAQIQDKGRFGNFRFTDPDAEAGFLLVTGEKKRSPHRMFLLGRQGRKFSIRQLDRMLRISAETYDGFFRRPLSHFEQLRLLMLRIFHECGPRAA